MVGSAQELQRSIGNQATMRVVRGRLGAGAKLQRLRTHDYRDNQIRQLAALQQAQFQAAQVALTAASPIQYVFPNGVISQPVNQMQALKARVRGILQAAGVVGNLNTVMGQAYNLDVGLHRLSIWSAPAGPQPILSFDVAVIPHGGTIANAQAADTAWAQTVVNMTYQDAVARPFRENHVIDPIPAQNYELALAMVAVHRQRASTLIQLTPLAQTNLIQEVQGNIQANAYTTAHHFVTAATYPMLDIDPTTNPATPRPTTPISPTTCSTTQTMGSGRCLHFHGARNRANIQALGQATAGVRGAITKTGQGVSFVQPTAGLHIPLGGYQMRFRQAHALEAVRVQINEDRWQIATADPAAAGDWVFAWSGYGAGRHTVRIEGQEQRGRRTDMQSLTVQVP